jgi:RNA polymerase sigma factor (sigma-70 family)
VRVRDWDDAASWKEFYALYRKLIFGLARRSGLSHADAEDVTQDVFKRVAETIHEFECDPERGTFRGWLMNLTRWRVANKITRAPREDVNRSVSAPREGAEASTSTINRLPDPSKLDAEWDLEWQRHLLDAACERISRRVNARHYQAFDLYVRRGWPVLKVAGELGMNPAAIYLIGNRLKKQLKVEVEKLKGQLG